MLFTIIIVIFIVVILFSVCWGAWSFTQAFSFNPHGNLGRMYCWHFPGGKTEAKRACGLPNHPGCQLIEVKFELGDVRVQALSSDRPSLSLNVSGKSEMWGPRSLLLGKTVVSLRTSQMAMWLSLCSDFLRGSWWRRAESDEVCRAGFLEERAPSGPETWELWGWSQEGQTLRVEEVT